MAKKKDASICCLQLPLRTYLAERRLLLSYQVSAIKGQIARTERELADVTVSLDAMQKIKHDDR